MYIGQKIRICAAILIYCLSGFAASGKNPHDPVRGLWVVRNEITNPSKIDRVLSDADRWHITDLFVQVRGRGDAYYHSRIEPHADNLLPGFDPLGYLLLRARNYNFRVHAWINVFYIWSRKEPPQSRLHPMNRFPDQMAYPANYQRSGPNQKDPKVSRGNSEGVFVSPLLPAVQRHIFAVVDDLLDNYPVDGIHFDYIRFPNRNFDFRPEIRRRFRKKFVLDPLEFKQNPAKILRKYSSTGYEVFVEQWAEFLRNGLSDFVHKITDHIRKRKRKLIISAAVKADLSKAHWEYFQEWDKWVRKGWLDWALPMNYTPVYSVFKRRLDSYRSAGAASKCVIGIALYNQPLTSALSQIKQAEKMRFHGIVLFSYRQLNEMNKYQQKMVTSLLK